MKKKIVCYRNSRIPGKIKKSCTGTLPYVGVSINTGALNVITTTNKSNKYPVNNFLNIARVWYLNTFLRR